MYIPHAFEETRVDVMHDLMRRHPFATLVTCTQDGPDANHLPLLVESDPAPYGTLRGHVAKANPLWRDGAGEQPVLAIFQGPHTYVSPSWYPSKREHGKVVPTWNYAVVHARGTLAVVDEPGALRAHVQSLTTRHESGRRDPWQLSDAPEPFIEKLLGGIRGVVIQISQLEGKWKMSQNRDAVDRRGVVEALQLDGSASALAVAEQMQSRS
ncbi:MAG: FMN-binding negative transcriptional regulator, partial [Gammaproteobacteria bacterium]